MQPTLAPTSQAQRYDALTIRLHWLSAALILALWAMGQTIDWFPKGTGRVMFRSLHITLGVVLLLVLAFRLRWRFTGGTRLPAAGTGASAKLAVAVHHLLYLLMAATVLVGLVFTFARGDNLFNLFSLPALVDPANRELRHDIGEVHELAANLLLLLALAHAAMGLLHRLVIKDGVMERMLPPRP